jgi:L,D-transpeptidase catalytic domain
MVRIPPYFLFIPLVFACCFGISARVVAQNRYLAARSEVNDGPKMPDLQYLTEKLWEADDYCRENGLNTEAGIFIDLGMNSGYFRCWVIGFGDGVIRHEGLVAHGSGKNDWLPTGTRKYSNEKGSLLSSLGKYKTGSSFMGQYGLSYRLYGLEASNSNAFSRAIVLHAHRAIPDVQSSKALFQSWGCPAVSPNFLKKLSTIIDKSEKPMLIWIFDSTR